MHHQQKYGGSHNMGHNMGHNMVGHNAGHNVGRGGGHQNHIHQLSSHEMTVSSAQLQRGHGAMSYQHHNPPGLDNNPPPPPPVSVS